MKIPKIYLETTIFNFPFADDAPQYKADTLKLFEEIKAGKFEPFTSIYVTRELENTKEAKRREKLKALITDYGIKVITPSSDTGLLADQYINAGIIPDRYKTDALHIAQQQRQSLIL
jgi:hypothetical protein